MKIYTKTGDAGTTSLIGGERVPKTDLRVEAYGTVDELIALTAVLADDLRGRDGLDASVGELDRINSRLMTVSALLAVGAGGKGKVADLPADAVAALEASIDRMQAQLEPLTKFTIPGGCPAVSSCHVCRTVCRRAERAALRARAEHPADDSATVYLNRLSDYFYALGRYLGKTLGAPEILWIP